MSTFECQALLAFTITQLLVLPLYSPSSRLGKTYKGEQVVLSLPSVSPCSHIKFLCSVFFFSSYRMSSILCLKSHEIGTWVMLFRVHLAFGYSSHLSSSRWVHISFASDCLTSFEHLFHLRMYSESWALSVNSNLNAPLVLLIFLGTVRGSVPTIRCIHEKIF